MAASTALAPSIALDVAIGFTHRTLRPFGDIDMTTAPMLVDTANAFMSRSVGDLTIDFAEVTFADSALLHALLDIRGNLRARGAGLLLVNEPPCVERLFLASQFRAVFAS